MFKKISTLVVLVFVLAACGREETVTICEIDQAFFGEQAFPGYTEITFEASGDRLTAMTEVISFELDYYLTYWHMTLDEAIEFWEGMSFIVPDGLTIEVVATDTHLVLSEIVDLDELSQRDLVALYGVDENARFISLEQTVEIAEEERGAVCQVQ